MSLIRVVPDTPVNSECESYGEYPPSGPDARFCAPCKAESCGSRVAGVMITSLTPCEFLRGSRVPGTASRRSPVIEQVADRPGPKKQSNISNEEENSMAERVT
jgi:hypothetical protein